jgi:hypothetical protein
MFTNATFTRVMPHHELMKLNRRQRQLLFSIDEVESSLWSKIYLETQLGPHILKLSFCLSQVDQQITQHWIKTVFTHYFFYVR